MQVLKDELHSLDEEEPKSEKKVEKKKSKKVKKSKSKTKQSSKKQLEAKKPLKQKTVKKSKKRIKVEGKSRNLLKDPKILQDIEQLFEDLKGSREDDFVDSSTILFLLNMLEVGKSEPEYFWYIYTQLKDLEKLSKAQFVELFMNPPEYHPNDIEDIKNLFNIFDVKGKGSFSKKDFTEFFKFSPIYQADPQLVEGNLDKCFKNLEKIFGNKEVTPVEFYQILHHLK